MTQDVTENPNSDDKNSPDSIAFNVSGKFRLAWLFLLPPAAILILHKQDWRIPAWVALIGAIAILTTVYLRAALIATIPESKSRLRGDLFRWCGVVLLVGLSAMFDWQRWIVEQFLLEIAAFSVAAALIALRKASLEGGLLHGPWLMVLAMFVVPASGLLYLCGKAILHTAGSDWQWHMGLPLLLALGVSIFGSMRNLAPYTIGTEQLHEPFSNRFVLICLVIWFFCLLFGMPYLLSGEAES